MNLKKSKLTKCNSKICRYEKTRRTLSTSHSKQSSTKSNIFTDVDSNYVDSN